jgi:hypothetical protein
MWYDIVNQPLYHSLETFLLKMSSRACSLTGYIYYWGLLIVTTGKRITIDKSYSDARSLVIFFGFHIVTTCFNFAFDTKEKAHQNTRQSDLNLGVMPSRTNQIASCFDVHFNTCKCYGTYITDLFEKNARKRKFVLGYREIMYT